MNEKLESTQTENGIARTKAKWQESCRGRVSHPVCNSWSQRHCQDIATFTIPKSKHLTAFKLVSTKHKVVLYLTFNISLLSYVLYDFVQEKNPHIFTQL